MLWLKNVLPISQTVLRKIFYWFYIITYTVHPFKTTGKPPVWVIMSPLNYKAQNVFVCHENCTAWLEFMR